MYMDYNISMRQCIKFLLNQWILRFSFFPRPVRCIYFEQRAVQSAHKNTTTIKILKAKVENRKPFPLSKKPNLYANTYSL